MLKPVVKRSTEDTALDALREYLVSGAIQGGARLTEQGLADELHISRATVRSALHRLAVEGLVRQVAYTGWHVVSLGPDDVRELFTLRAVLEGLAARLTVEALTPGGREQLEAAWQALCEAAEAGNEPQLSACDFALHETIVALSGHQRLRESYRQISQQIRLFIASSNLQYESASVVVEEHRPLMAALFGGDAEVAARAAEEHIRIAGEELERAMRADG